MPASREHPAYTVRDCKENRNAVTPLDLSNVSIAKAQKLSAAVSSRLSTLSIRYGAENWLAVRAIHCRDAHDCIALGVDRLESHCQLYCPGVP